MTPAKHKPLTVARTRTDKVKDALEVAGAELVLTNEVLQDALPDAAKNDALVTRALEQNLEVEEKVQKAADELDAVSELLKSEEAHSERLENIIEGLKEKAKR